MASTDSCLARSMKAQVLTTITSASLRVGHELVARALELAEHHLAVHQVLRAAEAHHADGLRPVVPRAAPPGRSPAAIRRRPSVRLGARGAQHDALLQVEASPVRSAQWALSGASISLPHSRSLSRSLAA